MRLFTALLVLPHILGLKFHTSVRKTTHLHADSKIIPDVTKYISNVVVAMGLLGAPFNALAFGPVEIDLTNIAYKQA